MFGFSLFSASKPRPKARQSYKASLEVLEDRTVPATISVTGVNRFQDTMVAGLTSTGAGTFSAINLRSAIVGANSMAGADTIVLEAGTYHMRGDIFGEFLVSDPSGTLTIKNGGAGFATIDAHQYSRAFLNQSGLSLTGIKVQNGYAYTRGGGIYNNGTLSLVNSQIVNNTVEGWTDGSPAQGGGIYNHANRLVSITNSTFSGNRAIGGASQYFGFGGNAEGGGAYFASSNFLGTNSIVGSTFSGNKAIGGAGAPGRGGDARGGALFSAASNQALSVLNSTFSANAAEGGKGKSGDGGDAAGGAIFFQNGGLNNATLVNDTIAFNKAVGGLGDGAGYTAGESLGGGLSTGAAFTPLPKVGNSIVANNSADTGADVFGYFASLGSNLIGDVTGAAGSFTAAKGDFIGGNGAPLIDPGLDPLANYGGLTQTHRLKAGSFAIDRGNNALLAAPINLTTDQRGQPRRAGLFADIGAYEVPQPSLNKTYSINQATALTTTVANGLLAGIGNPLGKTLTVQLVSGPTTGTLTMNANGTFTYRPPTTFYGTATFRFRVLANGKDEGIYTATINVARVVSRYFR